MLRERCSRIGVALVPICAVGFAQAPHEGSAVVRVGDAEHTIPIECEDAQRPELGFSTEPARVTRQATGRTSGTNLRVRRWEDTDDLIVTLDRYVAWIPMTASAGGVWSVQLDMSPLSVMQSDGPVLLTYDMWTNGERPPGIQGVRFEAICSQRDPGAPSTRRLPPSGAG